MSSDARLRVTFLGTGTSMGIPVVTCRCEVCTSEDPRNRRLRAGLLLEWDVPADACGSPPSPPDGTARVLVDTSTDLRQQCLRAAIERVDGVLYTHAHADHVLGLDELRIFNFVHRRDIPIWGDEPTLAGLRRMFAYAFEPGARGVPRLDPRPLADEIELFGRRVAAVPVEHGESTVQALRLDGFAYVTDCSGIPAAAAERLADADVLVIDALRREPHPSHFTLEEALREIERLQPRQAYLTHLSHVFDHAQLQQELPEGVDVAHDGLVLPLPGAP